MADPREADPVLIEINREVDEERLAPEELLVERPPVSRISAVVPVIP